MGSGFMGSEVRGSEVQRSEVQGSKVGDRVQSELGNTYRPLSDFI